MIYFFTKTLLKRSYAYLSLTFFSIAVGAFLLGGSVSLSRSISNYFVTEGQVLIGGDIVLSGSKPIDARAETLSRIGVDKITLSSEYSVQAVFKNSNNSSTVAASIRAVDDNFPLYGSALTEPANFSLTKNGIYAQKSFLDTLGARVGDNVLLGDGVFRVLGVITKEPGSTSLGASFTPRVIMRAQDFGNSNIDLTQSRSSYKLLIKENRANSLSTTDRQSIESFAQQNKLQYDDSSDGPNNFVRGLSSVKSFLGIVLAVSLFLVSINIITNLTYILSKFKKTIAIMKTFGATSAQIQSIYSLILGIIGFSAGAFGTMLGAVASNSALPYIASFTGSALSTVAVLPTGLLGGAMGLLVILSAALPFFRSLRNITTKQLLSNVSQGERAKKRTPFLLYIPIPLIISLFLYILSSDLKLVAYSMLGLIGSFVLFMAVTYLLIRVLYKVRESFPFIVRSVITSLSWRGYEAVIVIASIMTAFSGVFIVSTIEKNILVNISQNVSAKAPSLYLIDITKSQIDEVTKIAGTTFVSYPIVRGRLLEVNGRDMTASDNPEVTREFSMTYRSNLLNDETIESGVWHADTIQNSVSIDDGFAQELGGVSIGDTVKVFIQGLTVEATVTSTRSSNRSSGTPFFFLVFSPDVISRFPASYFGSADVLPPEIARIKSELGSQYPNIIPIETGQILSTVNDLLTSVILALKVTGIPSILLGVILVLVMTGQSIYERRGDVLVFRAFGFGSRSILSLFIIEIVSLILIASIFAYAISHGIAYALNRFLFSFTDFVFDITPLIIILCIMIVSSLFAYIISRQLINSPLKNLLSEK